MMLFQSVIHNKVLPNLKFYRIFHNLLQNNYVMCNLYTFLCSLAIILAIAASKESNCSMKAECCEGKGKTDVMITTVSGCQQTITNYLCVNAYIACKCRAGKVATLCNSALKC